jgi:hypothetical protein
VALTPVVKEGWILPLPSAVLDILSWVSGELPLVVPLSTQDLTPLDNGLRHINSMMQPSTASSAPVIGVALTTTSTVPGSATGVTSASDLDVAVRFCIEVAKHYGSDSLELFDEESFDQLVARYGSLRHLQTMGSTTAPTDRVP